MDELARFLKDVDERHHHAPAGRVFFCSTPPRTYTDIVRRIGEARLAERAKIVFEKPFGHDLASAKLLADEIHAVFDESQVYRIDHYLGKETVRNVLAFRFANGLFEPVWNRSYIDHVQVTVAESIGIEGRGEFYEGTGAIRDVVVTHLFQVMTFLAMEPPVSFDPGRVRDETVKLLRATNVCDPARIVRGQYRGCRDEPGVARDSTVETYAAMELEVDNWRWADVPFFLRTGKGLAAKVSEVTLKFRKVPFNVFRGTGVDAVPPRDHLTDSDPAERGHHPRAEREEARARARARPSPHGLRLRAGVPHEDPGRLRGAAPRRMEGDHTLFLREDGVERAWEIVQPVLDRPLPVAVYDRGSWGPPEADDLAAPPRWHVAGDVADA